MVKTSILIIFLGPLFSPWLQGEYLAVAQKERLCEVIGRKLERRAYAYQVDFGDWDKHLAKHWEVVAEAETEKELQDALNLVLGEFGLSHLAVNSPSQAGMNSKGLRTGMGITIKKVDDGAFVLSALKEAPAWEAGIRRGDTITEIDGKPVEELEDVRAEPGATRHVAWKRNRERHEAKITYRIFPFANRSSMQWLNNEVAVITINSFQYRYYRAGDINRFFKEARSAKGIIIDLRDNHGGLHFYAQHLASKISDHSVLYNRMVFRKHFVKAQREYGEEPSIEELAAVAKKPRPLRFSKPYQGKVVVLVDGTSASGADLFPAFVQESGRGNVIGTQTAGALQLARTFSLPYRFRLYAPIAEALTPEGNRLEGVGLEPDIELDFRETADDEVIFARALEVIETANEYE